MDDAARIQRERIQLLAEAALVVGATIVLGNLRLVELPAGGSISLATLPLVVFAATRGVRAALGAGLAAGLGHALCGGTVVHPAQLALDYGLAWLVLALVGLARTTTTLRVWIVAAFAARLASFTVSGVVFFVPAATPAAWGVSLAYNAVTVLPDLALVLALAPVLVRAHARAAGTAAAQGVPLPRTPRIITPRPLADPAPPAPVQPPRAVRAILRPPLAPPHLPSWTARLDGRPAPLTGSD